MIIQRTHRYVNIAAAISIVVLLAGISTLAVGIQRTAASWRWVNHTREVLEHVQGTESLINEADALQKSLRLDYNRRDDADFQARLTALPEEVRMLAELTADNPVQQKTLADLRPVLAEAVANQCRVVLAKDQGVYFLAEQGERRPDGRVKLLAYAVGCNPDTDPFDGWWELARAELGGDDFGEFFDPKEGVFARILRGMDDLMLSATTTHLSLEVVPSM